MHRTIAVSLAFLAPIPLIYLAVLLVGGGAFTYTLDDAYIHLALAKNIWLGHYGINLTEHSAPSSSILWPFLLAPFASVPLAFEHVPLLINAACAVCSGFLLLGIFPELGRLAAPAFALVMMMSMNLYGLVFTGMEHSLQILLVLMTLWGLTRPEALGSSRPMAVLWWCSLCLLPLVRYEGMAISLPVLAYQYASGSRRNSVIAAGALIAALIVFSLYLHAMGLGFVPSSVLAKSSYSDSGSTFYNFLGNIQKYGFLLVPVWLICYRKIAQGDSAFAAMLLGVSGLHFLFGKYAWYGRYEVYYVMFVVVLALKALLQKDVRLWWIVLSLPFVFFGLVYPTVTTPWASANIHNQQALMARIANILDEDVAVNDLGLVAFRGHRYVLDLWGLGSLEALRLRTGNAEGAVWIANLMQKKGVHYAFVYDDWFASHPANWIKVAELRLLQKKITAASDVVALYATSDANAMKLRAALGAFSKENSSDAFALSLMPH